MFATSCKASCSPANSEPLSEVTVLNSWPKYAPARSLSCRTAWLTDSASFPASFRMTSKRVCRSTNVSSTASDLVLFPTTVSTSQWPKVFRVPTASGRSSMDFLAPVYSGGCHDGTISVCGTVFLAGPYSSFS